MTDYPSVVLGTGPAWLADAFPTILPDPERLVYEYLHDAAGVPTANGTIPQDRLVFPEGDSALALAFPLAFERPPDFAFFRDRAGPPIPVVRGWPAYPGKVPAIGVATGTEGEDDQRQTIAGGFAGTVYATDDSGAIVGSATYFSEPLYVPVVVQLLHENRDERDRLHNELRRVLFPLRRVLPMRDSQIFSVSVAAEKAEAAGGPPEADQPFLVYLSIFTVHVTCEMLEATDVSGQDGIVGSITVTPTPF